MLGWQWLCTHLIYRIVQMAVEDFLRESKGTLKSGIVGMEGERKGKERMEEERKEEEGRGEEGKERRDRRGGREGREEKGEKEERRKIGREEKRRGERRERGKRVPTAQRAYIPLTFSLCEKQD